MDNWNIATYPDFIHFVDKEAKKINLMDDEIKEKFYSYIGEYSKNRINWFYQFLKDNPSPTKEQGEEFDKYMADFNYARSYINTFLQGFIQEDFNQEFVSFTGYLDKSKSNDGTFVGVTGDGKSFATTKGDVPIKPTIEILPLSNSNKSVKEALCSSRLIS